MPRPIPTAFRLLAAASLLLTGAAGAQPVDWNADSWQIAVEPPDSTFQCDATPELQTSTGLQTQSGTVGPFAIGVNEAGDFPGRMRTGDDYDPTLTDAEILDSCGGVTVEYGLGGDGQPLACANTQVDYTRDGVEVDLLSVSGRLVAASMFDEGVQGTTSASVPGFQLPGDHTVVVTPIARNGGDGIYEVQELALSCDPLSGFVSIGGGLQDPDEPLGGRGNKQGLKRPTHVFAGTIGILEADASILGKLKILYKSYPGGRVNCRFEPGDASSLDIVDGVATLSDWEYTCRGKRSIGTFSGMADLVVVGADDSTNMGPKAGHTKDRGGICVVADVAELDLGDACGEAADALPLDRGRARVGSTDGGAPSDGGVPQ